MTNFALEVKNLSVDFLLEVSIKAVNNLSWNLKKGETLGIV